MEKPLSNNAMQYINNIMEENNIEVGNTVLFQGDNVQYILHKYSKEKNTNFNYQLTTLTYNKIYKEYEPNCHKCFECYQNAIAEIVGYFDNIADVVK